MGAEPFVVNVARLRAANGTRRHEVRRGPLDPYEGSAPPAKGDSALAAGADVTCDVVLESFPGGVMVTGTVSAPWEGTCRRCTAAVGGDLCVAVRERYTDEGPGPADEDAYPIVDQRIDLGLVAHDAVVLELPLAPLCSEACRGLCPSCGVDRNVEACDCRPPADPRWASLDVLRSAQRDEPAPAAPPGR